MSIDGVSLDNAVKLAAAQALADMDLYVLYDNAISFSCGEAEAIAAFLDAFGGGGDEFLTCHAAGDDDKDDLHEVVIGPDGLTTGWKYREETNA